jgi:hypothetical protein
MEYWNVAILGLAELDLFFYGRHGAENKIRPSFVFDPQYSIFPSILYSMVSLVADTGPLGQDFFLFDSIHRLQVKNNQAQFRHHPGTWVFLIA